MVHVIAQYNLPYKWCSRNLNMNFYTLPNSQNILTPLLSQK